MGSIGMQAESTILPPPHLTMSERYVLKLLETSDKISWYDVEGFMSPGTFKVHICRLRMKGFRILTACRVHSKVGRNPRASYSLGEKNG